MDDSYDTLTQQLAVVLRDRADAVRALPDAAAMRTRLTDAAPASLPSPRVLAAAACTALVLGGAGVASAVGGGAPPANDASLGAARELPSTEIALATAAVIERVEDTTTTGPPTTIPATSTTAAATTTVVAPPTTSPPVAPPVEPAAAEPEPVATTTTAAPPEARSTTTAAPVVAPTTTKAAPPTTVPPPTTTKVVAFTMVQKWKRSSASPPFEEFSGTARAGATITVTSNYGGGTTVVDAAGKWALRVEFPTAPLNVSFTGKVKTDQGQKSFTFKRESPPA